ncbi:MAG: RagB/SusD family nutrient uptake outer membrane protein [Bacteroidales bacterium]|jgi:hypothetical protein|nr:RagB/SusD family nutrient uptake outer membrane protein [Bacteroidales bacterium]
MKKTFLYLAALATAASATIACDDFLEETVNGQQTLDSYFVTEDEATSYLNGCYNALTFYGWWQIQNFWIMTDMCSDDMWMGNLSQSQGDYYSLAHYQGVGQSNGPLNNYWMHRYKGILSCNVAINRIPNAHFQDTQKQERFIAEAKFLRGYFYFDLVRNFGGVPIVNDFMMPEDVEGITRSSASEVWALVEQDFRDAAAVLPERSQYPSSDLGRATKGAALGYLGKSLVYQEKWQEAATILKQVIDSKQYELMEDFGDVWNVDTNNNKESLFEIQTTFNETYALGNALSVVSANRTEVNDGWAWGLPTSDLEQAFIDEGDYERLRWTIIKTGATEIAGEDDFAELVADQYAAQSNQHSDMIEGTYYISPDVHKSARVSRKLYIPYKKRPSKWSQDFIPLDIRLLRYADILLLYAEACNELGNDSEAQWALNQVRNRVGRDNVTSTGNTLKQAIRTERRLELALEYNRLYDIRRWESIKNPGHKVIAEILGPNGSFVKRNTNVLTADPYEYAATKEPSDKGSTFDESRDLLFPIPLYEIEHSNGSITQNPGWN